VKKPVKGLNMICSHQTHVEVSLFNVAVLGGGQKGGVWSGGRAHMKGSMCFFVVESSCCLRTGSVTVRVACSTECLPHVLPHLHAPVCPPTFGCELKQCEALTRNQADAITLTLDPATFRTRSPNKLLYKLPSLRHIVTATENY
jgi:hypothetical protein